MSTPPYPPAPRDDLVEQIHGEPVADPYRRLEDSDSLPTKTWLTAQDDLLDHHRTRWSAREHFRSRLEGLLRIGFQGPPVWRRGRRFDVRRDPDQEHPVLHTTDTDGKERVLVDPMVVDPAGTTTLDVWTPSPDGTLLAYQLSESGTEESAIRVLDVVSGEIVDGPVPRTRMSPVAWLPDAAGYYYVRRLPPEDLPPDEAQYHRRVWFHRLGSDPADDPVVFGDGHAKEFWWHVSLSRDGRWLLVSGSRGTDPRNDLYLADLSEGEITSPSFTTLRHGVDARTSATVGIDGRLYVWTDLDAPRGRLMVADPGDPRPERWKPLVDEDPEAVLSGFALLDDLDAPQIAVSWTRHAVSEISLHDAANGRRIDELKLPGLGSVGGLLTRYDGGHELWFTYTDHLTPVRVLHYDARTARLHAWAEPPGGAPDTTGIGVRQVEYTSYDGTTVRMFVVGRDDAVEPRPTILYGYGGFGISMTPGYSAGLLAWVEAGGSYAIACLRGGGEEGEDWHRAGMLDRKQRVFDDLHAAAEWLIDEGVTRPAQLALSGGSNGGLLVGAALTQRPDLYRSVVCSAPLLDMVRFERFGLGRFWSGEYGTADDPDQLRTLLTYSPYHRVQAGLPYPATLFTVFGSDTRVDPLHARKMCAALQAASTSDPSTHPVLIRVEGEVGHGARSVSRSAELVADTLAFQAWCCGLKPR